MSWEQEEEILNQFREKAGEQVTANEIKAVLDEACGKDMVLINRQIIISNSALLAPAAVGQSSFRYKILCQIILAKSLAAAKFSEAF